MSPLSVKDWTIRSVIGPVVLIAGWTFIVNTCYDNGLRLKWFHLRNRPNLVVFRGKQGILITYSKPNPHMTHLMLSYLTFMYTEATLHIIPSQLSKIY